MAIEPEAIITKIPIIDKVLIFSEKKIIPYKVPHNICKKIKGLIILLYLPAIWYALVKAQAEIITIIPELENSKNSFHVDAIDYGIKKNILRYFSDFKCKVTVVSCKTSAENILA